MDGSVRSGGDAASLIPADGLGEALQRAAEWICRVRHAE